MRPQRAARHRTLLRKLGGTLVLQITQNTKGKNKPPLAVARELDPRRTTLDGLRSTEHGTENPHT